MPSGRRLYRKLHNFGYAGFTILTTSINRIAQLSDFNQRVVAADRILRTKWSMGEMHAARYYREKAYCPPVLW